MTLARLLVATAALSLSLGLGGCVTIFPKTKPAQLYSFGDDIGQTQQPAAQTTPVSTLRMSLDFSRAADREQLLTTSGSADAYIASARWISPASILFGAAAEQAFEADAPSIRLLQRGDNGNATLNLRVEVQTFETDYGADWHGDPTVVIRVRTLLTRAADQGPPLEGHFVSRKPAGENRIGAIVQAYDGATADVLKQVVDWTADHAR